MDLTGGLSLLRALDYFAKPEPVGRNPLLFGGIRMRESTFFPFEQACGKCGGSGDGGEEATYCRACKGAGRNRYEGVMQNGEQTIVITSPLPKAFAVGWPASAPVPVRPSAGIRAVSWPALAALERTTDGD